MIETDSGSRDAPRAGSRLVLLSTDEFVTDLAERLARARRRIDIQLMTFDGDRAGLAVADLLVAAVDRGVAVRLLIDSFARRFVSDTPVGRATVRDEYSATRAMYDRLVAAGARLRFTHPYGPLHLFAPARNHKKLFLIDDVVHLGGVNVSDHNFAWHDFMVRFGDPDVVEAVARDFDAAFQGRRLDLSGPSVLTNREVERTFDRMVAEATRRVVVASPYALDRRLVAILAASPARRRQVVLAPDNNFRILDLITPYLHRRLLDDGVEVVAYRRFSHAKFLLADDRLLLGSSNYGRHSFWCNQEIGVVIDDRDFVDRFERRMLTGQVEGVPLRSEPGRHLVGQVTSAAMIAALVLYARLIAHRVPGLDPRPTPWRAGRSPIR